MKIFLSSVGGIFLLVVAAVAVRFYAQRRVAERIAIHAPNGIATLEKIRLGGVEQWIKIRGSDKSKPVLLFLHGGPGFSAMPFAQVNAALADDFVVVEWDQRGAGKSWSPNIPSSSMTVEQIVADTQELVQLLRQRFGIAKIFLVAHSWGTIIGARTVAGAPELFSAYVAISRAANPKASERAMYRFAMDSAHAAGASKAETELREIGWPPYRKVRDYQTMNRWIHHFSDAEYREITRVRFVRLAFASPAYSWLDFVRLWRGFRFSFDHLWREAFATDFFAEVPRLDVPVSSFSVGMITLRRCRPNWQRVISKPLNAPQGKELVWFGTPDTGRT